MAEGSDRPGAGTPSTQSQLLLRAIGLLTATVTTEFKPVHSQVSDWPQQLNLEVLTNRYINDVTTLIAREFAEEKFFRDALQEVLHRFVQDISFNFRGLLGRQYSFAIGTKVKLRDVKGLPNHFAANISRNSRMDVYLCLHDRIEGKISVPAFIEVKKGGLWPTQSATELPELVEAAYTSQPDGSAEALDQLMRDIEQQENFVVNLQDKAYEPLAQAVLYLLHVSLPSRLFLGLDSGSLPGAVLSCGKNSGKSSVHEFVLRMPEQMGRGGYVVQLRQCLGTPTQAAETVLALFAEGMVRCFEMLKRCNTPGQAQAPLYQGLLGKYGWVAEPSRAARLKMRVSPTHISSDDKMNFGLLFDVCSYDGEPSSVLEQLVPPRGPKRFWRRLVQMPNPPEDLQAGMVIKVTSNILNQGFNIDHFMKAMEVLTQKGCPQLLRGIVLSVGESGNACWILMKNLTQYKTGRTAILQDLPRFLQQTICEDIQWLAQEGLLHWDLRPNNFLLLGGQWKLIDWDSFVANEVPQLQKDGRYPLLANRENIELYMIAQITLHVVCSILDISEEKMNQLTERQTVWTMCQRQFLRKGIEFARKKIKVLGMFLSWDAWMDPDLAEPYTTEQLQRLRECLLHLNSSWQESSA